MMSAFSFRGHVMRATKTDFIIILLLLAPLVIVLGGSLIFDLDNAFDSFLISKIEINHEFFPPDLCKSECPWENETFRSPRMHDCNPWSRSCHCLAMWLGADAVSELCPPYLTNVSVRSSNLQHMNVISLLHSGWLSNEPDLSPGLYSCHTAHCRVVTSPAYSYSDPLLDAYVFSVQNSNLKFRSEYQPVFVSHMGTMSDPHISPALIYNGSYPSKNLFASTSWRRFFDGELSFDPPDRLMDIQVFPHFYSISSMKHSRALPLSQDRHGILVILEDALCDTAYDILIAINVEVKNRTRIMTFGSCDSNINSHTFNDFPRFSSDFCQPSTGSLGSIHAYTSCVMSHFHYCLIIDASSSPFHVEPRFWDALHAGCIPIYKAASPFGANYARSLLPSLDAAIFVNDFESLRNFALTFSSEIESPRFFRIRTAWKSSSFSKWSTNFLTSLQSNLGTMICTLCDAVATNPLLHSLQTPRGEKLWVRPCIRDEFNNFSVDRSEPQLHESSWLSSIGVRHVYIMHYTGARARKPIIKTRLSSAGIFGDWVEGMDSEELMSSATRFQCVWPESSADPRGFSPASSNTFGEVSLSMKHMFAAFDVITHNYSIALFLEDDVSFGSDVRQQLEDILAEASLDPAWDFIFVGGCLNLHTGDEKLHKRLFRRHASRCTHAYLISFSGAVALLRSLPLIMPIDFQINELLAGKKFHSYWVEPPIFYQEKDGDVFKSTLNP